MCSDTIVATARCSNYGGVRDCSGSIGVVTAESERGELMKQHEISSMLFTSKHIVSDCSGSIAVTSTENGRNGCGTVNETQVIAHIHTWLLHRRSRPTPKLLANSMCLLS